MNLSPRKHEEPDVNLTPMIDVVFLLLLFFMVSTSFIHESSLKVNLPQASGEKLTEQPDPVNIVIKANGEFLINDQLLAVVDSNSLSQRLQQIVADTHDPHIIISADADAKYQHIVTAMDTLQHLGYSHLTLAARQKTT